ncbi:MAG: Dyp-type peroxidase [Cellvibrionaceae bacterium]
MASPQSGILATIPATATYLSFNRRPEMRADDLRQLLAMLGEEVDGNELVVGVGAPLAQFLAAEVPSLKPFPALMGSGIAVPSTQSDLWLWLRRGGAGEQFHRAAHLVDTLQAGFELAHCVEAFQYSDSRDLTGYVDGTENPTGSDALAAAIQQTGAAGLLGSSFVAVQQWQHDFSMFESMSQQQQDHTIGRRRSDNVELDDAPASAHVKRTAQESFDPEAFVVRRSMPWRQELDGGLQFVAFGSSFDAFEAQLKRMMGMDDGIVDGLFNISRPLTGEYYWCPPMTSGRLDLSVLGIQSER